MHEQLLQKQLLKQTFIDYATQCIQPAKDFFEDSVNEELSQVVSALKAARLFSPSKVHEMKPTTAAVDELKAFPFLSDKLEYLMLELPMYIAAAKDVSHTTDMLEWWKSKESKLPHSADRSMEAALLCSAFVGSCWESFFSSEQIILQATGTLYGRLYRIVLNAPIQQKRLVVTFDFLLRAQHGIIVEDQWHNRLHLPALENG